MRHCYLHRAGKIMYLGLLTRQNMNATATAKTVKRHLICTIECKSLAGLHSCSVLSIFMEDSSDGIIRNRVVDIMYV